MESYRHSAGTSAGQNRSAPAPVAQRCSANAVQPTGPEREPPRRRGGRREIDGVGELLQSARQAQGITLSQASAETRIRRAYLEAIENDDFRLLPDAAYTSGFLRNYARYLGLSADEVVQTYHALYPPPSITVRAVTKVVDDRLRRRARRRFAWIFGAVFVLLVGAAAIQKYNSAVRAGAKPELPISTSGLLAAHAPSRGVLNATSGFAPATMSLSLHAVRRDWVRVTVGGRLRFQGTLTAGSTRRWHAAQGIAVVAAHGNAVTVRTNGHWIGHLGRGAGQARGALTAAGWRKVR